MPRRSEDALFQQLIGVYRSFKSGASMESTEDGPKLIYRGHLGKLFKEHGLEGSGYVRVRDLLMRLDCIDIIYQGNANQTSVVIVNPNEPTREDWTHVRQEGGKSLRQVAGARVGIQIGDIAARLARLERAFAAHIRAEDHDDQDQELPA